MKSNSPIHGSLNYVNRKNELQKQIDENIRMLKKIHFVKPTVQLKDHQKHATKHKQLKEMVSEGSMRQAIVQAAR